MTTAMSPFDQQQSNGSPPPKDGSPPGAAADSNGSSAAATVAAKLLRSSSHHGRSLSSSASRSLLSMSYGDLSRWGAVPQAPAGQGACSAGVAGGGLQRCRRRLHRALAGFRQPAGHAVLVHMLHRLARTTRPLQKTTGSTARLWAGLGPPARGSCQPPAGHRAHPARLPCPSPAAPHAWVCPSARWRWRLRWTRAWPSVAATGPSTRCWWPTMGWLPPSSSGRCGRGHTRTLATSARVGGWVVDRGRSGVLRQNVGAVAHVLGSSLCCAGRPGPSARPPGPGCHCSAGVHAPRSCWRLLSLCPCRARPLRPVLQST